MDYLLHDQPVSFLKGKLRLRQVTRLCDGGHQTQVITSRWDLRDIEVAYRMFERWRQENFFKYMREEFLLDALIDYQIESEDPTRTIPNPERRALDKEIRAARADLAGSNAIMVPPPRTMPNGAGRQCGASTSASTASSSRALSSREKTGTILGRRDEGGSHAWRRPASEKRQGTKSREVVCWRCSGLYGVLIEAPAVIRAGWRY